MTTPMTKQEFDSLRKLVNKAKKHVKAIGECNEYETSIEAIELQALRETATELLNLANEIQSKHN